MNEKICRVCRWYEQLNPNDPNPFGLCHRYPPFVFFGDDPEDYVAWPEVEQSDWCGEWAKSDEENTELE